MQFRTMPQNVLLLFATFCEQLPEKWKVFGKFVSCHRIACNREEREKFPLGKVLKLSQKFYWDEEISNSFVHYTGRKDGVPVGRILNQGRKNPLHKKWRFGWRFDLLSEFAFLK